MDDTLITVNHVSKKFCRSLKHSLWYGLKDLAYELCGDGHGGRCQLRPGEFWAVKDVGFEVRRGECIGVVGRNGAGKTTLLRMLNGLIKPDIGRIELTGRIGALIALGAGFNPVLTARENIYVSASVLGISRREIKAKFDEIVDFAEVEQFIDAPVQSYSSGMKVRLGFAIASVLKPDILLLDEVLAVGDANFRSKCIRRIGSILSECAVVFVSHDAWAVRRICDSIIWLDQGRILYNGNTESGMQLYGEGVYSDGPPSAVLTTAECFSDICYDTRIRRTRRPDNTESMNLDVTLSFNSTTEVRPGLCLGNVITLDEQVAGQFDFRRWVPTIREGHNIITFQIVDLQLARGKYSLALVIYDESNKKLLLNLRYFSTIYVDCNTRYGPHYAIATSPLSFPP